MNHLQQGNSGPTPVVGIFQKQTSECFLNTGRVCLEAISMLISSQDWLGQNGSKFWAKYLLEKHLTLFWSREIPKNLSTSFFLKIFFLFHPPKTNMRQTFIHGWFSVWHVRFRRCKLNTRRKNLRTPWNSHRSINASWKRSSSITSPHNAPTNVAVELWWRVVNVPCGVGGRWVRWGFLRGHTWRNGRPLKGDGIECHGLRHISGAS